MFRQKVVYKAIKKALALDFINWNKIRYPLIGQDSIISMLIHDVFGGEILKTHYKKGWHFYNKVDGVRIDLARANALKSSSDIAFEDVPATPEEAAGYFDKTDYFNFLMKFVSIFEETVGLGVKPQIS